jgi:hypothetical protein
MQACLYPSLFSMQCACIVWYCHLWPICLHHIFPHCLIYHYFRKRFLDIKCVSRIPLQPLSTTCLILRIQQDTVITLHRIQQDTVITLHSSSRKLPVMLVRSCWNLNFVDTFSKNIQISNLMKIRPEGSELSHVDRHTDMEKLIVVFGNFAKEAKNRRSTKFSTLIYFWPLPRNLRLN